MEHGTGAKVSLSFCGFTSLQKPVHVSRPMGSYIPANYVCCHGLFTRTNLSSRMPILNSRLHSWASCCLVLTVSVFYLYCNCSRADACPHQVTIPVHGFVRCSGCVAKEKLYKHTEYFVRCPSTCYEIRLSFDLKYYIHYWKLLQESWDNWPGRVSGWVQNCKPVGSISLSVHALRYKTIDFSIIPCDTNVY